MGVTCKKGKKTQGIAGGNKGLGPLQSPNAGKPRRRQLKEGGG